MLRTGWLDMIRVLFTCGFMSESHSVSEGLLMVNDILLISRASRPADFNYKHDAKHNSMFVCAQLWEDDSDDTIMNFLETAIFTAKAGERDVLGIVRVLNRNYSPRRSTIVYSTPGLYAVTKFRLHRTYLSSPHAGPPESSRD